MSKTTTNLLGIIITILAGTYFYLNYCSECAAKEKEEVPEKKEVIVPAEPEATSYPFAFKDGDYAYNVNDNFNFNVSSSSILTPISSQVDEGIGGLKSYLLENDAKVLNIKGYYKGDEINSSAFPNLGLARSNAVKNYLVTKEIPSSRINTMGELMDSMVPKDKVLLGPIAYNLDTKSEDAETELKVLYDKIKTNPLVLYFETGETSINLTPKQRQKVADISRYLDKVDGATAIVTGHTDNVGQRSSNVALGQGRADFAKAYLINNGIPEAKIQATSEGPDSPIESNTTEQGRSKNRRTVVTLN
ncbi:MAG: OmpA family protein [Bacteroidota bacterium]